MHFICIFILDENFHKKESSFLSRYILYKIIYQLTFILSHFKKSSRNPSTIQNHKWLKEIIDLIFQKNSHITDFFYYNGEQYLLKNQELITL